MSDRPKQHKCMNDINNSEDQLELGSNQPHHVNFWHTQAAKEHDFRADLEIIGNIANEPRRGKEL